MTAFKLSKTSRKRLVGVHPQLAEAVEAALAISKVDFGVACGLRTIEEQADLVESGASRIYKSKHLKQEDGYGHAVDLFPYIGGSARWEHDCFAPLVFALHHAAGIVGIKIRWGGCWKPVHLISKNLDSIDKARLDYIDSRRRARRRPFVDCPHFELMR